MISIEEIRSEFPEAREAYGGDHVEYYVHCRKPHKKGGKFKMSINAETGVYYCHDCGASGNALDEYLLTGFGLSINNKIHRPDDDTDHHEYDPHRGKEKWADEILSPGTLLDVSNIDEGHPAKVYLAGRGISEEDVARYGIKYCASGQFSFCRTGTTSGRIIFPVWMSGKLISWQARCIDTYTKKGNRMVWRGEGLGWMKVGRTESGAWDDVAVPKYYTCPGSNRSKALLGFDVAVACNSDYVVMVEGPVDCIRVGGPCVATLGFKITNQQMRIIKSRWSKVCWILDGDMDTESDWFVGAVSYMSQDCSLSWCKMPGRKDAGEATDEEIERTIKQLLSKI